MCLKYSSDYSIDALGYHSRCCFLVEEQYCYWHLGHGYENVEKMREDYLLLLTCEMVLKFSGYI